MFKKSKMMVFTREDSFDKLKVKLYAVEMEEAKKYEYLRRGG